MKVLAIVCVMCIAHLTTGRSIDRTDLDVFGLGRDLDDNTNFHTTNIRSKNINNRNPFKDDDQTVNVVKICKRRDLNDMYDLDMINDIGDRFDRDRNDRYNRYDRDYNNRYDRDFNDRLRNDRDLIDRYNNDRNLNGGLDTYDRDDIDRNDRDNKDCVVLQIKGKKKHTNHVVVLVVKDNDPDQEIRHNNLNDENVVFVTVNKKLGSFTRRDINDDDIVGRADTKDTIGALKWVHRNIHKYGGDRHQVMLVLGRKTARIGDVLKNTRYDGNLYRQIILQTMDNDNKNTIKNQIKWDIANEVGCLNVNNQDDIDKCLKYTTKMRLDDAKRRVKQKFGGDLNDIYNDNNRRFGMNNREQQNRFDNYKDNDRNTIFNLRNNLIGGRNDRFDDLDDNRRGGLRNRNFGMVDINDIWNNIGRQGRGF